MNFQYTVDPYAEEPIMLINTHIGNDADDGAGIDGSAFMAELLALDMRKPKSIQVYINCVGGGVAPGFSMYSAILLSNTPVDTVNVGIAASIAGVIFQAGRIRTMMDYSFLMYHEVHGTDDKKLSKVMNESISHMVARSGKTAEEIRALMAKTTYIGAAEALANGMCDKVTASSDQNKKRFSSFAMNSVEDKPQSFWKEANAVLNSIVKIEDNSNMKQVANKLGLSPEASESSILDAVSGLQNKITDLGTAHVSAIAEVNNKLTTKEAELLAMTNSYNTLKAEKDAADQTAAAAADIALTEKCKNMVEGFAKIGKIKNAADVILFWTELAKANFEIVKNQIEALPVNKVGPEITKIENTGGVAKYTMAGQMGLIANKLQAK